jgi:hypothetical protein
MTSQGSLASALLRAGPEKQKPALRRASLNKGNSGLNSKSLDPR